jgi:hypothetical protein
MEADVVQLDPARAHDDQQQDSDARQRQQEVPGDHTASCRFRDPQPLEVDHFPGQEVAEQRHDQGRKRE